MSSGDPDSVAPLEARYSIPGHAAVLAVLLVLLIPAIWFLHASWLLGDRLAIGIGLVGVGLFGPYALAVLARIVDRRVRLRITEDTVWFPDHSDTPIPRRSIKRVGDRGFWIAVWLHKPSRFPPTTLVRRIVKRINPDALMREQYGDVWLYPALLDCSRADLFERI